MTKEEFDALSIEDKIEETEAIFEEYWKPGMNATKNKFDTLVEQHNRLEEMMKKMLVDGNYTDL